MGVLQVHVGWQPQITIGLRLRALRRELGRRRGRAISQEEMASLLHVGSKAYGAWEADRNHPDDETLLRIVETTGCSLAFLEGHEVHPEPGAPNLQVKSLLLLPVELAARGMNTTPDYDQQLAFNLDRPATDVDLAA